MGLEHRVRVLGLILGAWLRASARSIEASASGLLRFAGSATISGLHGNDVG